MLLRCCEVEKIKRILQARTFLIYLGEIDYIERFWLR